MLCIYMYVCFKLNLTFNYFKLYTCMFIFVYICMCRSLDIYPSCSFTLISSYIIYIYTLWHLVLGIMVLHPQGMLVSIGGDQSVESGTTCRLKSSTKDREQLFRDTLARLSHAIEVLDSSLSSSTTLPNREKVTMMQEQFM